MRALPPLFFLLVLLGGCTQPLTPPIHHPVPPAGKLLCADGAAGPRCNFQATVDPVTRQANELSIAVNPTNSLNLIATGKDYTPDEAGDCTWSGLYATLDGGKTWKDQNVPGSPWKHEKDPRAPTNEFTKFWCATDPVVAFGPDGTAYWAVMPYQCDPLSGSKTGRGTVPSNPLGGGGLNDWFWTCSAMFVLVSHDGGLTWPEWKQVAFGPRLEHDKEWISTAPNGNVLLCWDRADDVSDQGAPTQPYTGGSAVWCSVSKDKGKTWTNGTAMNPNYAGFDPSVDYDANGVAYAALADGKSVLVARSDDGLHWSKPVIVGNYTLPPRGGENNWPVLRGSAFRIVDAPLIAVDPSVGAYAGSVYVIWFDHSRGEGDVLVSSSRDGGKTWGVPVRPHDDDSALKSDQFLPAISVGPDGTVDASWYDRRDDPVDHVFHLYYAYSKDGGATWSKNLRVSDVPSDEQYSHHQNGMIFLGDYRDQDSSASGAHLAWVDTRNHKADVFTATVER